MIPLAFMHVPINGQFANGALATNVASATTFMASPSRNPVWLATTTPALGATISTQLRLPPPLPQQGKNQHQHRHRHPHRRGL